MPIKILKDHYRALSAPDPLEKVAFDGAREEGGDGDYRLELQVSAVTIAN